MTLLELQQQIIALQEQLNLLKGEPVTSITPTVVYAEEGNVFQRKHDGLIMGSKLSLGYDYSLGFRRIDKVEFYKQIPNPDLEVISENEE